MKRLFFVLFVFEIMHISVNAQDVTKWRGENSSGIYKVDQRLNAWPAEGPQILWSFTGLGQGFSSPAFANNKIYATGMIEGQATLFVLAYKISA